MDDPEQGDADAIADNKPRNDAATIMKLTRCSLTIRGKCRARSKFSVVAQIKR